MGGRLECVTKAAALWMFLTVVVAAQSAQQNGSGAGKPEAAIEPSADGHGGISNTIQVHGAWTIVVRNSDGSIASMHEFENSIASGGPAFFARLMARQGGQFYWGIRLENLCGTAPSLMACLIAEPPSATDPIASNFYHGAVTSTLTIANPTSGPNAYRFVLSGSMTAANTGQITNVSTSTFVPNGTTDLISSVTATTLQQPIAVQAGQTIDVTVVITCS